MTELGKVNCPKLGHTTHLSGKRALREGEHPAMTEHKPPKQQIAWKYQQFEYFYKNLMMINLKYKTKVQHLAKNTYLSCKKYRKTKTLQKSVIKTVVYILKA